MGTRFEVTVGRIVGVGALWFCASTALVQTHLSPQAGQPRAAAGAISGVVTDGGTKRPVFGALVQLLTIVPGTRGVPPTRPRQMTDASGRFVFQQLAVGVYRIQVSAPGYLDWGSDRVRDSGTVGQVTLQDRQWFGDANAVLSRPASISGMIRDERGEPLVDIPVRLLMAVRVAGRDQWASGPVTHTDDRGAYRFAGLIPGRYLVDVPSMQITLPDGEVSLYHDWGTKPDPLPVIRAADGVGTMAGNFAAPPGHGVVYPATFYPAGRSVSTGEVIALDSGSQRSAVDVSLAPVSSVRVSGAVTGPATAIANLPVRLLPAGDESLGFGSETALTKTDSTGKFTLAQVPQGEYTVLVGRALNEVESARSELSDVAPTAANPFIDAISSGPLGHESGLFLLAVAMSGDDATGRLSISVGTDAIDGLVVPTRAAVTLSGHALFDGADAPAAGRATGPFGPEIGVEPADGDLTHTSESSLSGFVQGKDDPRGSTFSIRDVVPGHYRLTDESGRNSDYRLVGATWHGQDLFATPLDVTGDGPVTGIVVYLSSKRNSVSGVVRAADGKITSAGAVLIFPQDPNRWREPGLSAPLFHHLAVSVTGEFSTANLIPGDYFIAAVPLADRGRALDIEFLKALAAQAKRITLDESATLTMDLRVIGGPR